jgi:trehalose 6-phosphate phosphatase
MVALNVDPGDRHKEGDGDEDLVPIDQGLGPIEALLEEPSATAVMVDFDGTLASIVEDPNEARAVPGASKALRELTEWFACVAVISGRPGEFLARRLRSAGRSVRLFGLYGMQEVVNGEVLVHPAVVDWLPQVAAARQAAERSAPSGIEIEDKGISFTLHWRGSPNSAGWASGFAQSQSGRVGLYHRFGRMSVELMPPVDVDKGTVVYGLGTGMHAACFFGDDLGDLDAFRALDDLALAGTKTVRVAVADDESPLEVADAADVIVDGPASACRLLREIAKRVRADGSLFS